jgi:hypothetical protein
MPFGVLDPVVNVKPVFDEIDELAENQLICWQTSADYDGAKMDIAPDNRASDRY